MNYADIKTIDVQDGEGIRVSIYVSGCHFHCKGCHNKEAWDFNYGKPFTEDTINYIIELLDKEYISGLSILGGEPLEHCNQQGLLPLVKKVKEKFPNKTIWCYTGYDFEKDILNNMYKKFSYSKELIDNIDIIVDGQFEEDKKLIDLKFRGSTNQKKIDVKASIEAEKTIQLKFGDEERYEKKQPQIYWYQEFKEKNVNKENTESCEQVLNDSIQNNVIPFIPKIEIKEYEEKISADNVNNETTSQL